MFRVHHWDSMMMSVTKGMIVTCCEQRYEILLCSIVPAEHSKSWENCGDFEQMISIVIKLPILNAEVSHNAVWKRAGRVQSETDYESKCIDADEILLCSAELFFRVQPRQSNSFQLSRLQGSLVKTQCFLDAWEGVDGKKSVSLRWKSQWSDPT